MALVTLPLWSFYSKKIGKRGAYIYATLILLIMSATLWPVHDGYVRQLFFLQVALLGIGYGGQQLLSFSILPDVIDHDVSARESAVAGMYTGLWVAGEKIGLALGALFAGLVLSWYGFIETTEGSVEQPASALIGVKMIFVAVPILFFALSLLVIWAIPKGQTEETQATFAD